MSSETPQKSARIRQAPRARELLTSAQPEKNGGKKRGLKHRKAKKGAGRPTTITEEKILILLEGLMYDFTLKEALTVAGIPKTNYHSRYNKDALFRERIARAEQYALTLSKKTMLQQIEDGDGALALRFLERRQPERYRTRIENENPPIPPMTVILPGARAHPRFSPAVPPKKK